MNKITVQVGTAAEFFQRGRKVGQLIDQAKPFPAESVITFEDPHEMLELLTMRKLTLFRAIKERSGSISAISERLNRNRGTVTRDVAQLAKVGLVIVESRVLPGRGRIKEVSVTAQQFRLEVMLA